MITSAPSGQKPAVNNRAEHWMTLIGILPFLLFGITSMVAKIKLPISPAYPYMIFSATTLIGLAIGLTRGIPRWTYSYLGWAVIMSMWWTMLPIDSFGIGSSSVILHRMRFGLLAWIPLLITVVIPSILAHSFRTLKQLLAGIWQDWTLLSLGFYTFGGFIFIQFDENHHPYLFALIIATTCTIAGGVWLFMDSRGTGKRVIALFTGFILSYIVARISYATWDWAAYYGLPPAQPEPWYSKVGETTAVLVFWSALMFWPVIFGLARTLIKNQQKPGTPA